MIFETNLANRNDIIRNSQMVTDNFYIVYSDCVFPLTI
ncbi:hypothetical protein ABI_17770 [Asticcacaulis biprosthecium C19]|uniref:Uncharacterized protein n=1 Tax=Asticcacaulis biprosthecium C19 TaxID=715226 RepID=F4QKN5_9CAUL|nr:hypothetical protein ABI_17770 [Asticcacaulis biprosthecium C19]